RTRGEAGRSLSCRASHTNRGSCVNDKAPVVFLIDDDPSVLKSVTRLLSAAGFETRPYSSPKSFLDNHDAGLPGCIVMDLAMPEINGLDLQKRLASSGYAKPVVFITGQG